jgi:hypothetical protein
MTRNSKSQRISKRDIAKINLSDVIPDIPHVRKNVIRRVGGDNLIRPCLV